MKEEEEKDWPYIEFLAPKMEDNVRWKRDKEGRIIFPASEVTIITHGLGDTSGNKEFKHSWFVPYILNYKNDIR